MKNLFKILSVTAVMLVLSATSAFAQANPGGVEVIKNGGYFIGGGCVPLTAETSSTLQIKNGNVHLVTIFWDLSGTCLQPAQGTGTATYPVGTPWGPVDMKVTPSGVAKLQLIINPNQPTP